MMNFRCYGTLGPRSENDIKCSGKMNLIEFVVPNGEKLPANVFQAQSLEAIYRGDESDRNLGGIFACEAHLRTAAYVAHTNGVRGTVTTTFDVLPCPACKGLGKGPAARSGFGPFGEYTVEECETCHGRACDS